MSNSFQKVKMRDVAQRAGVSPAAVSRYVNGTGYLSCEMQCKIQHAIDELNYLPDEDHPSRFPRWKVFGILLPPFSGAHFYSELGAQFEVNANRAGFHSLAFHLDFGTHTILDLLKEVTKERLAGIFMVSFPHMEFTEEEVDFIANSSIPILYLSEFITPYPTLNCILLKNAEAAAEAVRHLAAAGCRRLAFLGPPAAINKASAQRGAGFLAPAARLGLPYAKVFEVELGRQIEPELGRRAAQNAFSDEPNIDGLLCWSDVFAAGALWHLRQSGRAVPGQVRVVTFNNEYSPYLCPPVTALYLDPAEVTQRAVEQLSRLQNPAERMITKQIAIQPALIVRPSTLQSW